MSKKSGNAPPRGFAAGEYEQRLARAQKLMAAQGIGAMMLTTEPEVRYFSGFLTPFWLSPTRPWVLIVPRTGKPVAVVPTIGARLMAGTWIDDIRTFKSLYPDAGWHDLVAASAKELAGSKPIATLKGPETHLRMPLADYEALCGLLGGGMADASGIIRALRMVKSEAEVAKVGHVCQAVSGAFAALPEFASTGDRVEDVGRRFRMACLEGGADEVPYLVGGAEQGGYRDIIAPPSGHVLEDGDILILDCGARFDGYFCDFDRNYAFGTASDEAMRAHETLFAATEAGFKAARPGVACADIFAAMHKVISDAGNGGGNARGDDGGDVGRFGHGLGMELTEYPSLTAFDETVVEAGMVLTLEPGLAFGDGRVMVHEENIVIRDDGAEMLTTRAPETLPVIG